MLEGKDELVKQYLASIPFDRRLFRQDIRGSLAHAKMLAKQRIITEDDAAAIIKALTSIQQEIEQGEFQFRPELEDIHMNVETRLQEKLGDTAGKLHTARSRNDQIALDMRLFLKEETSRTVTRLNDLQSSLLQLAEANQDVIMPGYTHLQQAQPVLLAHHLLAYFDMLQRDKERFRDCLNRTDVLPLGSGALAGVSYAIDRDFLARELGFGKVSTNSLDAVSDRDFVVEFEAASALTMMHLSRLAEEIILWTSDEFGFIQIGEAYTTGSSIMPQKRNPDVAELARGKTGRVYGNLIATLTTMKALPLAYNRDMQEDKERVFDTLDTLDLSLQAFAEMIRTVKVNVGRVRAAFRKDYVLATDLADYLVKKGLPFREAHRVVSELSIYAMNNDRCFRELTLSEYNKFSPLFGQDVYDITLESSIAARNIPGGTSLQQVQIALARARQLVKRTP